MPKKRSILKLSTKRFPSSKVLKPQFAIEGHVARLKHGFEELFTQGHPPTKKKRK